mmetsp:Transcript_25143/g.69159  ORF Transcript_25143/g.69159 Transcript_25143/m.69159 type:complete len:127 (+) Transcript_25143:1679-2059(+)
MVDLIAAALLLSAALLRPPPRQGAMIKLVDAQCWGASTAAEAAIVISHPVQTRNEYGWVLRHRGARGRIATKHVLPPPQAETMVMAGVATVAMVAREAVDRAPAPLTGEACSPLPSRSARNTQSTT